MATLYLLAPRNKNNPASRQKDFFTIVQNQLGPDYGISRSQLNRIQPGMHVVLFDRDRSLQASGTLVGYTPTTKAANGVQRYDIAIRDLTLQLYSSPPPVNRFGVAIS